ncbi:hypothetical protein OEZ49_02405 [Ruegeria sp. WL0004]|uniref:TIGR04438 family Trp-rich protein n=1 Tax=Ruegeria marisflavi TaxID=2984152 RepID=A0ABT2WL29_9RHOB|nr:hypothetical protein [Ruegeria sp. WL0004]
MGLAFSPLGWLAALGAFVLVAAAFEMVAVAWPYLLLGLVSLFVLLWFAIWHSSKQRASEAEVDERERLRSSLEKAFQERKPK